MDPSDCVRGMDPSDCVSSRCGSVHATFAERFELQQFPLDTQELTIEVSSSLSSKTVELKLQQKRDYESRVARSSFYLRDEYQLSEHIFHTVEATKEQESSSNTQYPLLRIHMRIAREGMVYMLNFFFPLFCITSFSCASFYVPPSDEAMASMLNVTLMLVLTIATYIKHISDSVPKVSVRLHTCKAGHATPPNSKHARRHQSQWNPAPMLYAVPDPAGLVLDCVDARADGGGRSELRRRSTRIASGREGAICDGAGGDSGGRIDAGRSALGPSARDVCFQPQLNRGGGLNGSWRRPGRLFHAATRVLHAVLDCVGRLQPILCRKIPAVA